MSEDLNEFTLVERRKLLEIQAEAKRLCALNAALQKTIDDWRIMTCTWCGLEIPFDDDNAEAILEQMNQHALTCPADPRTQEIAALRARAERAEAELKLSSEQHERTLDYVQELADQLAAAHDTKKGTK